MIVLRFLKYKSVRDVVAVLLLLFGILMLSACTDPFSYRSSRISPHDFKGSEWQSNEPVIHLQVLEDGQMRGYLLLNSERIEIICGIDWGHSIIIHKAPEGDDVVLSDYILEGSCKCTDQKVVITVEEDFCFDEQYPVIVLERVE